MAFDQLDLVGDPVLLNISCLVIDLLYLLLNVVTMVLDWANEFITITSSLQVGALTVQSIDLKCLLLDSQESRLDLFLDLLHVSLLLLELTDEIIELSLEHIVLRGRIQVIETNTRDFICVVFDFNLLLGDVLIGNLCLL